MVQSQYTLTFNDDTWSDSWYLSYDITTDSFQNKLNEYIKDNYNNRLRITVLYNDDNDDDDDDDLGNKINPITAFMKYIVYECILQNFFSRSRFERNMVKGNRRE